MAWLQDSQSPWILLAVVGPPLRCGRIWSRCRMGALHHGVRQIWSRAVIKRANEAGTKRALDSIAIRSPEDGAV